jgi:hypothetical protein
MHGGFPAARDLFYGLGDGKLFVRLDGVPDGGSVQIEFEQQPLLTPSVAGGRILECSVVFDPDSCGNRFRVHIAHHNLTPVVWPLEGWLALSEEAELAQKLLAT